MSIQYACLRYLRCAAALLAGAAMTMVHAAEGDEQISPSIFSVNGFGTVGVVHSSERQADFAAQARQPKGAGFTSSWSATPDTKFGLQLTADFTDRLTGTIQLVSQYQYDATYTPDIEWANLKYQFTPDFSVRVGRIVLPTYLYSDSLNVGYVLPYVRIPMEIYGQLPVANNDGLDASYRIRGDGFTNTVQVYYGKHDETQPGAPGFSSNHYNINHLRGIADNLEYGPLTLHVSYQRLDYDYILSGTPLFEKNRQSLFDVGAIYDSGPWFVQTEWFRAPDEDEGLYFGAYGVAGIRFGKFTPYAGYARTYMAQTGALFFPSILDQATATLGLRWDFMRNTDLKIQFDRTKLDGGLNVYYPNAQTNFQPDGTVRLFSVAVDFVF